jgi:hypothetical protein
MTYEELPTCCEIKSQGTSWIAEGLVRKDARLLRDGVAIRLVGESCEVTNTNPGLALFLCASGLFLTAVEVTW